MINKNNLLIIKVFIFISYHSFSLLSNRRNSFPISLFLFSVRPLDSGWYITVNLMYTSYKFKNIFVKSELNCTPLSVVIVFGVPNPAKICDKKVYDVTWSNGR